jgi:transposase-like protein
MCDLNKPKFQDADKAREYLENLRWPNGPVCPHCGNLGGWPIEGEKSRPGLYKCTAYPCRKQFTVTVGTVFERSKIPLNKWLIAVHLMCASKKGVSAHQLHRMLGVTYKTAWFMSHRIREAMTEAPDGLLGSGGGIVEADETFGNERKPRQQGKKGRGYEHKTKILSLVERSGRVRSFHVPAVNAETLKPYLKAHIAADARLMTDEAGQYRSIGNEFSEHGVVHHGIGEYVRGDIHSNTVESYFSIFKRGLKGTFHHVSAKHLNRYCGEFDFRYNYRSAAGFGDNERANIALLGIAGKRLMYRD